MAVPGYPLASEQMAANYARWVTQQGVTGLGLPAGTLKVTASPIPSSNVIRVEATSHNPEVAVQAADLTSKALMDQVNQVRDQDDPKKVLRDIESTTPELMSAREELNQAKGRYDTALRTENPAVIGPARAVYIQAQSKVTLLETQQNGLQDRYRRLVAYDTTETRLLRIGTGAALVGDDRMSSIQRFGLMGAVVGAVAATVLCLFLDRRRPGPTPARRKLTDATRAGRQ